MNSPYMGIFRVSQQYKGIIHDGLDLVGVDSKDIHSTINGTVIYAGWENCLNKLQGFGQYVKIKQTDSDDVYYFGHLSEICVKKGDTIKITDKIGTEGSTGRSTGSHCHYCVRKNGVKGLAKFVFGNTYKVMSIKDDRVVIGINGNVTAAVNMLNVIKISNVKTKGQ